jgi:hypothetical protein
MAFIFLFAFFICVPLPRAGAQTPPPVPQTSPRETPPPENTEEGDEGDVGDEEKKPDGDVDEEPPAQVEKEKQRFYLSLGVDILFFIEDSSLESDPMPILPSFFASFGVPVASIKALSLYAVPDIGIYSTYYRWSDLLDKPVPAAIENREASIYGFVVGIGAQARYTLPKSFILRAKLGLSADFRLILLADGLNEGVDPIDEIKKRNEKVSAYFWTDTRWLFAHFNIGFDWKAWDDYAVGLDFNMQIPFNPPQANTGDSSSIGWRFGIAARLTRLF